MSGENEVIVACGWCSKVMKGEATEAEVTEAVKTGTNEIRGRLISHGICEPCKDEMLVDYETAKQKDEAGIAFNTDELFLGEVAV